MVEYTKGKAQVGGGLGEKKKMILPVERTIGLGRGSMIKLASDMGIKRMGSYLMHTLETRRGRSNKTDRNRHRTSTRKN